MDNTLLEQTKNRNFLDKIISITQLLEKDFPNLEWIVEEFLPSHGIVILGGDSGAYKTFLALYFAICICVGKKVFGKFLTKKSNILYLDEENGERVLQRKLLKVMNNEFVDNINFSIMQGIKLSDSEPWKSRLELMIDKFQPDLVIVDSLVRTTTGRENQSEDVKKIFDAIKPYKNNTVWLIIHHTRKSYWKTKTKVDLRGSSDLSAFADIIWMVSKERDNCVTLSQEKNRYQSSAGKYRVDIEDMLEGRMTFRIEKIKEEKYKTKKELCAEYIKELVNKYQIKKFRTEDIKNKIGEKFKHNAVNAALNLLVTENFLTKLKMGLYGVINNEGGENV